MSLTLNEIKKDHRINAFIDQTDVYMKALGYTDHGRRHLNIVSERAQKIARHLKVSSQDQELAGIAGWCHDMGNFLGRTQHHYWGAMLFSQCFIHEEKNTLAVTKIMQAITSHDKDDLKIVDKITACLIIADKSDVHRTRVSIKDKKSIMADIHDRVNYAVTDNKLFVDDKKKTITLAIKLDTNFTDILDYFTIFVERMTYCQKAADFLNYEFKLKINNTTLA
ncbi:MAG: uncharacterized protein QG603_413 [Patescibacteria group bacterium]|nr:uncharacterized protein [Patescibacteria group bacterium]